MSESTETALCVTCGEQKPTEKFHTGDCTCMDCNEAGRSGVNYKLEDGEIVRQECETCGELLGDHGLMRINGKRAYICPVNSESAGEGGPGSQDTAR